MTVPDALDFCLGPYSPGCFTCTTGAGCDCSHVVWHARKKTASFRYATPELFARCAPSAPCSASNGRACPWACEGERRPARTRSCPGTKLPEPRRLCPSSTNHPFRRPHPFGELKRNPEPAATVDPPKENARLRGRFRLTRCRYPINRYRGTSAAFPSGSGDAACAGPWLRSGGCARG